MQIKCKISGKVLFEFDTESMRVCVKAAVSANADLRSADLRSADLRSADLSYANLRSADLSSADLRYADLSYADLRSADLRSTDLSYADLSYADLRSADLRSANLRYADLRSADLSYADLRSADLRSAKYGGGIPITKEPKSINGLIYPVLIMDAHIKIGCELYSTIKWAEFDDLEISKMDFNALEFWRESKDVILALAAIHQK